MSNKEMAHRRAIEEARVSPKKYLGEPMGDEEIEELRERAQEVERGDYNYHPAECGWAIYCLDLIARIDQLKAELEVALYRGRD